MMMGRVTMKAGREGAESERQQRTEVNLDLKMTVTSLSSLMYYECILLDLTGLAFGFKVIYYLGICHSLSLFSQSLSLFLGPGSVLGAGDRKRLP